MVSESSPSIAIIGAGIAGLTAGLALGRAGLKVDIHEQAPVLGEVGAGLTVGPNASHALEDLGLGSALDRTGRVPRHSGVLDHLTGERLNYQVRGPAYQSEFGAPFRHIHRADLLSVLAEALPENVSLHLGHCLAGVEQDVNGVTAYFENGDAASADVLVACDGLKSRVRAQCFEDSKPEFTGYVAWRGLVDREKVPDDPLDPDFAVTLGEGKMFTRYTVRGRRLVNFVGVTRRPDWQREGWMEIATRDEALTEFDGWHRGVTGLLEALPDHHCFKWGLHVRPPLNNWIRDRVVLAGDAAHPMTPFLGLGAGMGIEDAWVLGEAFRLEQDPDTALQRYQDARLERANRVQSESNLQGLRLLQGNRESLGDTSLLGPDPFGIYGYDVTKAL